MPTVSYRPAHGFRTVLVLLFTILCVAQADAQRVNHLPNGSVEDGSFPDGPFRWTRQVFDRVAR